MPEQLVSGLIGALAAVLVVVINTLATRGKVDSETGLTQAQTQSTQVASALALANSLGEEVDRLSAELKHVRDEVESLKTQLETARLGAEEREHEISKLRFTVTNQTDKIAYMGKRILALEQALRQRGVDPEDINGYPV